MSPTFAFLIGLLTGLRSLTPAAAIARAAYLGWLHLPRPLAWMGTLTAVVIFSALALFELINDKRPTTPARIASPGLVARVVLGAFGGTCVAPALGVGVGSVWRWESLVRSPVAIEAAAEAAKLLEPSV